MEESVRIFSIGLITRNVLQVFTNKPDGFQYVPGQATEISIDKPGWENEKRPFTFTNLPDDEFSSVYNKDLSFTWWCHK